MLVTLYFYFYEIEFGIAYGGEVSTGLNVIPNLMLAIISNEKIVFMNSFRKAIKYQRLDRNPKISERFVRKLFTGLPKSGSSNKNTQP